jgi:DsbC/DsbD-like thiol-disulfide interchange protein
MKGLLFLVCVFTSLFSFSQERKVKWTTFYDASNKQVVFRADLDEGWHLYSQKVDPMVGPIPTSFTLEPAKGLILVGEVQEPTPIRQYDPNFEGEVLFFEKSVEFRQTVDFKEKGRLNGSVTYMVCNDVMCLPPVDDLLTIDLPAKL